MSSARAARRPEPAADVVIIGAGLAGAAAAWALSRRGRSVVVLEQFEPAGTRGSSHGSARIVRRGYGDALYTRLTGRAFELWREVESGAGAELLRMLGALDVGAERVPRVAELLAAQRVPHERLPAAEATRRWPGMAFDGEVVFHPQGGTMDAAGAVAAFLRLAQAGGARLLCPARAVAVRAGSAGGAVVELADGQRLAAGVVVLAAGAWLEALLGAALPVAGRGLPGAGLGVPPLRVTQQQVFHFPRRDLAPPPWPSVIHTWPAGEVFHLAGGRDGGPGDDRKIGEHDRGTPSTAEDRDGVVDAGSRERIVAYVRRWLPGLVDEPRGETTCLYTTTPSEDFILDRVGPVVVASPCSGHGAKFAPLIGELIADLVAAPAGGGSVPNRFRLGRHAIAAPAAAGSVSL